MTTVLMLAGAFPLSAVRAQEIPPMAPVLDIPEDVFIPTVLTIGGAMVEVGGIARAEYDSNIYAQEFGEKSDVRLIFQPYVSARKVGSQLEISARAEATYRQYLKYDTENAVGAEVRTRVAWSPTESDRVILLGGWMHGIEDRGEPEGRTITSIGPREFDTVDADLSYAHQGARFGVSVRGTAQAYRYDDLIDQNRNLDSYGLIGRGSYRLSPLINGFVEGFINKRDFAPTVGEGGLDRDSNTYGGRVGVAIDPGGTLRGDAAFGVYRFDPTDSRLEGRTGLSAQVGLIYQPFIRTAFTLDGFVGNVATYRVGARSREDMRVRVGVQQELRHNIRWQSSLIYRRSRFFGTGTTQSIYGATFEIEYLINRRFALGGNARYTNRDSTEPLDGFSRFRAGVTLKFHY